MTTKSTSGNMGEWPVTALYTKQTMTLGELIKRRKEFQISDKQIKALQTEPVAINYELSFQQLAQFQKNHGQPTKPSSPNGKEEHNN